MYTTPKSFAFGVVFSLWQGTFDREKHFTGCVPVHFVLLCYGKGCPAE